MTALDVIRDIAEYSDEHGMVHAMRRGDAVFIHSSHVRGLAA